MTSQELTAELARLDAQIDTAERERRWADVAPLRAEREHTERERQTALESEARAAAAKLASQHARERAQLEAESRELASRFDSWNSRVAALDAAARALWPELDAIEAAAAANARRLQELGGSSAYTGYLGLAAKHVRNGRGALRWRPGRV